MIFANVSPEYIAAAARLSPRLDPTSLRYTNRKSYVIIIVINRLVQRHKVVTSEVLGPGTALVSRGRRESQYIVRLDPRSL